MATAVALPDIAGYPQEDTKGFFQMQEHVHG